jgi:carboxyl-terminal processing protease
MRKLFLILAVLVMFSGVAAAPCAPPKKAVAGGPEGSPSSLVTKAMTNEQRQKNLESLELAWKTVCDAHYDPKLGGVDWQKVHDEMRPRIEKADSMDEARTIMEEMLGRLGHSHVGIIPASVYEDVQGDSAKGKTGKVRAQADPGFDVRIVDGEAVVVRVSAGRPAANAGVRPGWRIRKINGEELAPTLARIRKAVGKAPEVQFVQVRTVQRKLRGEEGQNVAVTFLDGSGKETTLSITRAQPQGNLVQQLGVYPVHVHFEARKVDDDIAYFYLSDFLDPMRVLPAFGDTIQKNQKAEGFILDLRGNPGGIVAMAQGLGGWFVDQPDLKLGTAIFRTSAADASLNPQEATYQGPVAILVDELSASTSEILAGGLQDLKRARVFGTRTAGACLPSMLLRLPNGDRLQYVIADYVSAGGKRLEGNGVQPDEVVPVDRQALLDGRDPTLDAAVQWIRSQRGGNPQK